MMDLRQLNIRLNSLVIFRNLLRDPVIRPLLRLLRLCDLPDERRRQKWLSRISRLCGKTCAALFPVTPDLSRYIADQVLADDNFYVRAVAAGKDIPSAWKDQLEKELETLRELSRLTPEALSSFFADSSPQMAEAFSDLPRWETSTTALAAEYAKRLAELPQVGYGIFARYRAFTVQKDRIVPVKHPDPQRLSQLFGYEDARRKIIGNTEAFLNGRGGNHMLLYGDAGTGKSSTIKAVAGEYADQGLRLIEIKKDQLFSIPAVLEDVAENPLKFLLFIDDLSFSKNDDNFSSLKHILEGSVSIGAGNVLIYATSNRRHLVRESAEDRQGSDIHLNDTLQETMSLAARFGLVITFQQPDKDEYLMIVDRLAEEAGLTATLSRDELHQQAEIFALRANGRTPRAAKQFVQQLKSTFPA